MTHNVLFVYFDLMSTPRAPGRLLVFVIVIMFEISPADADRLSP